MLFYHLYGAILLPCPFPNEDSSGFSNSFLILSPNWAFALLSCSHLLREEKEVMAELLRNYELLIPVVDYFLEHTGVLFLHVVKPRSGQICLFSKFRINLLLHIILHIIFFFSWVFLDIVSHPSFIHFSITVFYDIILISSFKDFIVILVSGNLFVSLRSSH